MRAGIARSSIFVAVTVAVGLMGLTPAAADFPEETGTPLSPCTGAEYTDVAYDYFGGHEPPRT